MHGSIQKTSDPEDGEELLFIRDFDGLAALVQLGVIEVHIWGATTDAIDTPDQIVSDLDPDAPVATYCGTGERAAHLWFVLHHLLGRDTVRCYDGSWAEWGNMVRMPVTAEQ